VFVPRLPLALAALAALAVAACEAPPTANPATPTVAQAPLPPPPAGGPPTLLSTTPPQSTGATPPGGATVVVAPTPPTGPVDGLYRGSLVLVRGEPFGFVPTNAQPAALRAASATPLGCAPSSGGDLVIGDQTLVLAYLPNVVLVAPVPSNGRLHATAGPFVLDGTLLNGALTATISSPACQSALAFYRMYAF